MAEKDYVWFRMKLTCEQKRKLERLAERRGTSQKEAVLSLIEDALNGEDEPISAQPGSFLDGIEHIIGSCEGPSDLLRDPDRMKGYGQ